MTYNFVSRSDDDLITTTTKTSPYQTTKPTVQKDKHVEEMNVNLSVAPLVKPNVARKMSTVIDESSSSVTKQTTIATEPNINVKPLKAVFKSKVPDVEANPIPTKVTVKSSSSFVVTGPKDTMKSLSKESRTIARTELSSVLIIKTTTSTQLRVQEPHVLESKPDLSVIPKAIFMETKTTSSVLQEPEVQKLKNVVLQSTTGANEVAVGTVEITSTSEVVDTKSTVTKIKEIVTSAKGKETYEITETNSYPVPKTTPLPTGIKFTEVESDSSTTFVKRIPGSHLLEFFFSEFETLTGICAVVLLGVVLIIYCLCLRK